MQEAIGRQNGGQGDPGQVHPLSQHLGPHQDIGFPCRKPIQKPAMALATPGGVPVETQQAQPLQLGGQLLHHPLGPRPKGLERRGAAVLTAVADLGAEITPVTAQPLPPLAIAVDRQGHIAVGAHHHFAATAAAQEGPITPPRHKNHGLLLLLLQQLQPSHQGSADQAPVPVGQLVAHVDHPHRRQGAGPNPFRETQELGSGLGRLASEPGFQRGRGTTQNQFGPRALSAQPGHIPGVIAGHRAVLLVGGVVLLIQHDQTQLCQRQKNG